MKKMHLESIFLIVVVLCWEIIFAEPNGAVLYLKDGTKLSHCNVPKDAEHHYFGYLEGPAWENKYSAFRIYVDKDNRNALDIIGKYKEEAILQYFKDPNVDEHNNYSWGTDIFKVGSSIGLGAFRLFLNNNWINPELSQLDSMVITIVDSSTQKPKVEIGYYGWNIGNGSKVTVIWTVNTTLNERHTYCELSIIGNYSGKVVVGMTNHKENTSNPNRSTIQLIQEQDRALLATLGKQGGLSEGFDDTLLMAIFTNPSYFDSFVKQTTVNYGMVLKPDSEQKVRWSFAYSWAREANPLFRKSNWKEILLQAVGIYVPNEKNIKFISSSDIAFYNVVTLSGRLWGGYYNRPKYTQSSKNLFIIYTSNKGGVRREINVR